MAAVAPVALKQIVDHDAGLVFPRQVLSDSSTALCLFSAAWHGRQDAYWVAKRGLRATCVDLDAGRLDEMRNLYPSDWEFIQHDAFDFPAMHCERVATRDWDAVVLDPYTNHFDRAAEYLPVWCAVANNVVILGMDGRDLEVPHGWQIVQRRKRSHYNGGVWWVVLEPTGQGITPDKVSACLVTRGDQPDQVERIIATLPYDEVIVWDNSREPDMLTAGRYMAAMRAKHDVVYFQDDDTLFVHHDKLMAAYEPGRIDAVYAHGENDGGYGDLPLVGGGGLADKHAVLEAFRTLPHTVEDYAYADFHVGVLTPFKHVHLPFEINYPIAQHPSRLVNQPWSADAKRRVTERARQIRDKRR
jgi:hypothetical protein